MLCDVARMSGPHVLIARTAAAAAASLVALQPAGVNDLSRQTIELQRVHHVVKKSSLVAVHCV